MNQIAISGEDVELLFVTYTFESCIVMWQFIKVLKK